MRKFKIWTLVSWDKDTIGTLQILLLNCVAVYSL